MRSRCRREASRPKFSQAERSTRPRTPGTTTYYFFDAAKRWRVSQGLQNNPADPNRIRYTYTATGRLATYEKPTASVSAAYTYDATGQRTKSAVTVSGQTTSTSFAYEGLRLLALSATQSGGTNPDSWKITYLYDEQGRPYGGVYRQPDNATTPLVFGILTTDRGDVVSLLDAAGAPFAAYRYDAWGNPQGTGNVSTGVWSKSTSLISLQVASDLAERQPLRYASYYYDAESGLYYLSARSYDPATRQFLSKDLSRNDGEESAYQYCGGNPIGFVDPTGFIADDTFFAKKAKTTSSLSVATKVAPVVVTTAALYVIFKNPAVAARAAAIAAPVVALAQQAPTWLRTNVWAAAARLVPGVDKAASVASKGYHAATAGGGGTTSGLPAVQAWPPNTGLLGGFKTTFTLQEGTVVDRYGYPGGTHLSPLGTSFSQRSLPAHYEWTQPYFKYEVMKPLEVEAGISTPWFGQDGLAVEYKTAVKIELLVGEYLREIR